MRSILLLLALSFAACEHVDSATPEDCPMTLPTSRNETATPGDPVSSDTINDLQDCIIGSKFGETPFYFPAAGFSRMEATGAGTGILSLIDGYVQGAAILTQRLPFLEGTELVSITFAYDQGNVGTAMEMGVDEHAFLVPTFGHNVLLSRTSTPAVHTTETILAAAMPGLGLPSTIAAGTAYTVVVSIPMVAHRFYGVRVVARRL